MVLNGPIPCLMPCGTRPVASSAKLLNGSLDDECRQQYLSEHLNISRLSLARLMLMLMLMMMCPVLPQCLMCVHSLSLVCAQLSRPPTMLATISAQASLFVQMTRRLLARNRQLFVSFLSDGHFSIKESKARPVRRLAFGHCGFQFQLRHGEREHATGSVCFVVCSPARQEFVPLA